MRVLARLAVPVFSILLCATAGWVEPAAAAQGCASGTTCLDVRDNGSSTGGTLDHVAQCSGRFPDFIVPAGFLGQNPEQRWFRLSQSYPSSISNAESPWKKFTYADGVVQANQFLDALKAYAFDGMVEAGFDPSLNAVRKWYHMPLMNFGSGFREPFHGLTEERGLNGTELGLKPGVHVHNYAIGFYNEVGAKTIGDVWNSAAPDLDKARFADGTMTFKILFSAALDSDFQDPATSPLAGAPEWTIATANGPTQVRLMQMDVAVVDPNSPTGWVFGTFAFDRHATDASPWMRLRPVGLSWGNDPGMTPSTVAAGSHLAQTIISDQAPPYALAHLGWAGRTNGPIDNRVSGCLSCHGTAQYPVVANLFPPTSCDTDVEKLQWFRNFDGSTAFGKVDRNTCVMGPSPSGLKSLDFSLQLAASVQSVLQFGDQNPCGVAPTTTTAPSVEAIEADVYSRISR
ncbi:MAG: hypothetical protein E5V30_13820 [Mesorhizobium sp.]|nr:MAG: hypothetical protein E5V30_13820 [Mesorhizobium sp.]